MEKSIPNEEMNIANLIAASEYYRSSAVVDVARTPEGGLVYLTHKEGKQNRSAASAEDMSVSACPYCNEAIPHGHVGEVADWDLTGNKYTNTDREILAVSKEHSTHLSPTDYRAWMHISQATGAIVAYSPARKSVPSHKHAPVMDFVGDSPLFQVPVAQIEDGVGLTEQGQHRAIVLHGEFEQRYEKTVTILRRLNAREHLFAIAIAPDRTFILPSKVIGKVLPKSNLFGVVSTEDRTFFEHVRLPAEQRDDSFTGFIDFSDCDYSDNQLAELVEKKPLQVPKISELQSQFEHTDIHASGVLSLSKDTTALAHYIASGLGVELGSSQFYFATDKRGNFLADCILPELKSAKDGDLLVVIDQMTDNIRQYLLSLKREYGLNNLHVLSDHSGEAFVLHTLGAEDGMQTRRPILLEKHEIDADIEAETALGKHIEEIKSICEEDDVYVEMVVALNVEQASNIEYIADKFGAATIKVVNIEGNSQDWWELNHLIQRNIVPYVRKYNPTPKRPLALLGESRELMADMPLYAHEEGAIVLYLDTFPKAQDNEAYESFLDLLANNTGKRIYVLMNQKEQKDDLYNN